MTVDWHSQEEMARNADSFAKLMHTLFGLYLWEWMNSLDFEYKIITGQRRFTWPLIFYFLNRYTLFSVLIGFMVSLNVRDKQIDCQALFLFIQMMGSLSLGLACVNLAVRTIAVWRNDRRVVIGLTVIILGHWAILLRDVVIIRSQWFNGQGCVITNNQPQLVTAVYIYAMGIDFIVMCLMGYKTGIQLHKRTRLVKILVLDGFLYFITAFLVNLVAVVFSALNLNPIMSVVGVVPATVFATIAACRAVRHLTTFGSQADKQIEIIGFTQPVTEEVSSFRVRAPSQMSTSPRPIGVSVPVQKSLKSPCSDISSISHDSESTSRLPESV